MEQQYKKDTNVEAKVFGFNGHRIYVKDFKGHHRNLRVLGYVSGEPQETTEKIVYSFEPIPIREQKACRTVLRRQIGGLGAFTCPITFSWPRRNR